MQHIERTLTSLGFEKTNKEANRNFHSSWRGLPPLPQNMTVAVWTGGNAVKMVCSDPPGFKLLLEGINLWEDTRPIIRMDDSLWGCPLGGLVFGCMGPSNDVSTRLIPPELFATNKWKTFAAKVAEKLVENTCRKEGLGKTTCILEVCAGYALKSARTHLTSLGYTVRTGVIKGKLQRVLYQTGLEHLSTTYNLPPEECKHDGIAIARYALDAGVPRTSFKWSFTMTNGKKFIPNKTLNSSQLELGGGI